MTDFDFDSMVYVPIFCEKSAEQFALANLSLQQRKAIVPLIDVGAIERDHAKGGRMREPIAHVRKTVRWAQKDWKTTPTFLDCQMPDTDVVEELDATKPKIVGLASQPYGFLLEGITNAIPVFALSSTAPRLNLVRQFNDRGACFRLRLSELPEDLTDLPDLVRQALEAISLGAGEVHLLLDLGDIDEKNIAPLKLYVQAVLKVVDVAIWRSFTLGATSFPDGLQLVETNSERTLPRPEWKFYEWAVGSLTRTPAYSDYGVASAVSDLDFNPLMMAASASLRYTLEDGYLIVKGSSLRKGKKFEQIRDLCEILRKRAEFMGADFSWGDKWIANCNTAPTPGNPTTWRQAGFTHHIAVVLRQLSTVVEF